MRMTKTKNCILFISKQKTKAKQQQFSNKRLYDNSYHT